MVITSRNPSINTIHSSSFLKRSFAAEAFLDELVSDPLLKCYAPSWLIAQLQQQIIDNNNKMSRSAASSPLSVSRS